MDYETEMKNTSRRGLKKEFEKEFMIRNEAGLWTNHDTFLIDKVWQFIEKALSTQKKQIIEEIKKLGNAEEYLSAYGNTKGESPWVKISEVRLKIDAITKTIK